MHATRTAVDACTHQTYDALLRTVGRRCAPGGPDTADHPDRGDTPGRDRGAVSLEQVLWFVAAGVSVAVVSIIIWTRIRDEANAPITRPAAP